jgi:Tfp pilus assembly protein PilX
MIEVVPDIQTSDVCCTSVSVNLIGVQMNEGDTKDTFDPTYGIEDGTSFIGDDIQIVGDSIFLRAERSGKSNGRVYTITFQATDYAGNSSTVSETVIAPHDQN